jgi:integrative and conjugative element protein (TIGR02256 family)
MLRLNIGERHLLVTTTVLGIFHQFHELAELKRENGGIVLGQYSESRQQVLVCRASAPGPLDQAMNNSFRRNRKAAQQIVEYEFYNSSGRNTYLGEWHTHPTDRAAPSPGDLHMIRQQFASNDVRIGFLLLFVVARLELFVGLLDGGSVVSVTVSDYLDFLD